MKIWTRTFGAALTLALMGGCTVTVGSGNGDDSDDLDFSEKSEEPETTEEDPETTEKPETTTTDEEPTQSETSSPTVDVDAAAPPASSSTPAETSSVPDETTSEPPPNVCEGEPDPGTCDACVKDNCEADWAACCAAEGCVETWTEIYTCVLNTATDDAWADYDRCAAEASSTGDALDLPYEVLDITSCVNSAYMGDDPGRLEGEGTCTLDCYGVVSLDE